MQTSTPQFVAVSKYRFGAPVLTDDGEEGSLDSLIVDATSHAITGMHHSRCSSHTPERLY